VKYSIIIPTLNHCDDLLKPCVDSILAHTHMDQVELIICANGCTDNTSYYLDRLTHQFESLGFSDHLKVITHDVPLGFAKACNAGISASKGDRVVLLNNDCVLLPQSTHDWLNLLNAPFESQTNTGITCILKLFSEQTQRDFAVFFCVMIDRKVINKVGLLNEDYQVGGGEDMEYCWVTEQAGFQIVNVEQTHYTGSTNTGSFPLYHKAEGTMHDASLVPEWTSIFEHNLNKLAVKVSQQVSPHVVPVTKAVSHTHVATQYDWLQHVSKESAALYKEVIQENTYQVTPDHFRDTSVIDVGANLGMFSILAAGLGAPQVISCEPVGSTYDILCNNLQRAHMNSVVQPIKAAIMGVTQGPVTMGINTDSNMNSLYKPGEYSELVPTVSLKQLIQMTTHPHVFLKMDCEGAEYDILMDSEDHVFEKVTHVAVEIHGDMHPTHKGLEIAQHRLRTLGFTCTSTLPFGMWWCDHTGTPVKFEPMNITIETWKK